MDRLPDLSVVSSDGTPWSLASLAGSPAVIYFYPKADTPGCTQEAQDFTSLAANFGAAGATVIGVSKDPPAKLKTFTGKHALDVRLASDADGAVCQAFGVWGEKRLYGRTFLGVERATFLFDKAGGLVREWRKVRVKGHAQAVLDAVLALQS